MTDTPAEPANLTPKQEAFCLAYVETGNASEAYRRSYDVKPDAKPEGIWVDACKLLGSPKVTLRVMQLQQAAAKRNEITLDSLTQMLKEDRQLAQEVKEPAAAINAVMAIAKLHGHVVDRKNVSSDNRHHHTAEAVSPFNEFVAAAIGARAKDETAEPLPN